MKSRKLVLNSKKSFEYHLCNELCLIGLHPEPFSKMELACNTFLSETTLCLWFLAAILDSCF
jgi:hypothetical protein